MANATKYQRMKDTFGGNWTMFSCPDNFFARYLHQKYYHRLSGDSLHYWAPLVPKFREHLWKWVCFDDDSNVDVSYKITWKYGIASVDIVNLRSVSRTGTARVPSYCYSWSIDCIIRCTATSF